MDTEELRAEVLTFVNAYDLAETTRASYCQHVFTLLSEVGDVEKMSPQTFRAFLTKERWGPAMRYMVYASVRKYLGWKYGIHHPALAFKFHKHKGAPQRTLTREQVLALWHFIADPDNHQYEGKRERDMALFCMLLDTGLRRAEICSLDMKHLNLSTCRFSAVIKGGNWAEGSFSPQTAIVLTQWLPFRNKLANPHVPNLFIALGGHHPGEALTYQGLRMVVKAWGVKTGIGALSPHDFRRSFATLATELGAPSRVVQIAGRWSDIAMVEHYTRALNLSSINPYSPISGILGKTGEMPITQDRFNEEYQ
jgi:integrase